MSRSTHPPNGAAEAATEGGTGNKLEFRQSFERFGEVRLICTRHRVEPLRYDMKTIAALLHPGFQILDLAVISVFEQANLESGRKAYRLSVWSESGGLVKSSSGATVDSRRLRSPRFDTLLVTGALVLPAATPKLSRFLAQAQHLCRRTAGVCTGAFLLAQAGVLDGHQATTHWAVADELKRRHPLVTVLPDRIFIKDRNIWTSAGMTACIDLGLALVEEDLGPEVARAVAKKMVVYHRRTSGQSQHSALLDLEPRSDRIQRVLSHARANLHRALSVEDLASVVHLSQRQFSRIFTAETGQSPAQAIEKLRVEAARSFIESGELALAVVAKLTGFGDPERMRRAFVRTVGRPPQAIRRVARKKVA